MWDYRIKDGYTDHNGFFEGTGYSGLPGIYRNSSTWVSVPSKGAIPPGLYTIGPAHSEPVLGPCVMALTPAPSTNTFKRSGFYIHGDSRTDPGDASHGCIVLGPAIREKIAASGDTELTVTP